MFPGRLAPVAGGDAHTHQDVRSHFHGDCDHSCQSNRHSRADDSSRADDATGAADADTATFAHSWAAHEHSYAASTGADVYAQATTTHEYAATGVRLRDGPDSEEGFLPSRYVYARDQGRRP